MVDGDVQDFKVNLVETNKHPLMTDQFIIQDQARVDQIFNVQPYISSGEEIGENHIVNEQCLDCSSQPAGLTQLGFFGKI